MDTHSNINLKEFWYTFTDWEYVYATKVYPKKLWFYQDSQCGPNDWKVAHTCKYGYSSLFQKTELFDNEAECQALCDSMNITISNSLKDNHNEQ